MESAICRDRQASAEAPPRLGRISATFEAPAIINQILFD
jgi:hypothetical protein